MQPEQIIDITVRQPIIRLERETENWSNRDRNIIKYVKRRPNFYKEKNIQKWKGSWEERRHYLWSMFPEYKYYKLDVQILHNRWLVIKTLYLYYYSRNINKNSKFFDGSLSFLNSSLPSDVKEEVIYLIPQTTQPSTEISQLSLEKNHPSSNPTKFEPSSARKTYLRHRKKNDLNKPTVSSQQHPKLEFYKPGSLVSGTLFEVVDNEEDMSETEAFKEYKSKFCRDMKDEDMLTDEDYDRIFKPKESSHTGTQSNEDLTIILDEKNNLASEEFVTLCQTGNTASAGMNNFVPLTETGQITTTEYTRYRELNPNAPKLGPFTGTRDFFREIGKYVSNYFSLQKQNETRLEVWSLITAAELKLLLQNDVMDFENSNKS